MFIYNGTSIRGHPWDQGYVSTYGRLRKKKTGALEGIQCPRHVSESF